MKEGHARDHADGGNRGTGRYGFDTRHFHAPLLLVENFDNAGLTANSHAARVARPIKTLFVKPDIKGPALLMRGEVAGK